MVIFAVKTDISTYCRLAMPSPSRTALLTVTAANFSNLHQDQLFEILSLPSFYLILLTCDANGNLKICSKFTYNCFFL